MAINKPGMSAVFKTAEKKGFEWNSDQSEMKNRKTGSTLKVSETGQSVYHNNTRITDASHAKQRING